MELYIGGFSQDKFETVKKIHPEEFIWNDFHLFVKEKILLGMGREEIERAAFEKIASEKIEAVIADELGCGIVPMERNERIFRETTGRVLCTIAAESEKVFRVVCGICQRLK